MGPPWGAFCQITLTCCWVPYNPKAPELDDLLRLGKCGKCSAEKCESMQLQWTDGVYGRDSLPSYIMTLSPGGVIFYRPQCTQPHVHSRRCVNGIPYTTVCRRCEQWLYKYRVQVASRLESTANSSSQRATTHPVSSERYVVRSAIEITFPFVCLSRARDE